MRVLYAKYASYRRPEFRTRTLLVEDGDRQYAIKEPLTEEARPHVAALLNAPGALTKSHPSFEFIRGEQHNKGVRYPLLSNISFDQVLAALIASGDLGKFQEEIVRFARKLREGSVEQDWSNSSDFNAVFGQHSAQPSHSLRPTNVDLNFSNILLTDQGYLMIDPEWVFDFPVPVDFILYRAIKQFASTHVSDVVAVEKNKLFDGCGLDSSQFATFDAMEVSFQNYVFGENVFSGVPAHIINRPPPVGLYIADRKSVDLRTTRFWRIVTPIRRAANLARKIKKRLRG